MSLYDEIAQKMKAEEESLRDDPEKAAIRRERWREAYFRRFPQSNREPVTVSIPVKTLSDTSVAIPEVPPAPEVVEPVNEPAGPVASSKKRDSTPTERTLYRIIGALAQALAEAKHTDRVPLLRDGKAFPGGGVKMTGVAGYLLDNGLTDLGATTLQDRIGTALKGYERPQPRPASAAPDNDR